MVASIVHVVPDARLGCAAYAVVEVLLEGASLDLRADIPQFASFISHSHSHHTQPAYSMAPTNIFANQIFSREHIEITKESWENTRRVMGSKRGSSLHRMKLSSALAV